METMIRADEISRVLKEQIKNYNKAIEVSETGSVLSVGDGVARVYGLEKAMVKEQMPRHWAELVGARVAGISEVRSFEDGVLRVHVTESAWRSELILRREELRKQLNTTFGDEVVKEIIIR